MLLPDNIKPENSIYYNGAVVLQTMQNVHRIKLVDLYYTVYERCNMSFPVFLLSLDWLFLIEVVKVNDGEVNLCS